MAQKKPETVDGLVVVELENAKLFSILNDSKKLIAETKMQIIATEMEGKEMYFLIMGKTTIPLNNIPCLKVGMGIYTFATDECTYGLKLPSDSHPDVLMAVQLVLEESTLFKQADYVPMEAQPEGKTEFESKDFSKLLISFPQDARDRVTVERDSQNATVTVNVHGAPVPVTIETVEPNEEPVTVARVDSTGHPLSVSGGLSKSPPKETTESVFSLVEKKEEKAGTQKTDRIVNFTYKVAEGIEKGSDTVASTLLAGGQAIGKVFNKGAELLMSRLTSGDEVKMSERSKRNIQRVRTASGAAVKVSKAILDGALGTVSIISSKVSSTVRGTAIGKKLFDNPSERTVAAKEVAVQSIAALAKVYESLETAGLTLLGDLNQATVKVVHHKYGDDYAQATSAGLGVVKDVNTVTVNMRRVGIRAMTKATIRQSTFGVIRDQDEDSKRKHDDYLPQAYEGAKSAINDIRGLFTGENSASSASSSSASSSFAPVEVESEKLKKN
jgi:hypothetical protein